MWIGQNAVILPGVHIGDGAIVGANSVVGSDIDPYTIVVGNPAKVLRKRFDEELIDLILRFKWWDRSIEEINALILRRAGVRHIEISEDCTMCQPDRFWSHRVTGGNRGSQGAVIVCTRRDRK